MSDPLIQLEQLYHDTAPALLGYFRRQLAVPADADDLLQETFVRAIRGFDQLQQAATPRAYLFGIAHHVRLDALRRRRHHEPLSNEPIAPPAGEEDARLEPMRAAIARLPESQRETLLLKLQQELSYAEIAQVLGIPVGTVRSRLHFALLHLRNVLNPSPSP